jgi:hypothetical protein
MAVLVENYKNINKELQSAQVTLIAVSKTKSAEDIMALYDLGQRDFGENYVQELVEKESSLPKDIQSNKVKYIAPFVHLIHGVDSEKLIKEIDKLGKKLDKKIGCLLQMHIAQEETKFGFSEEELSKLDVQSYENIAIQGLMGMASFTNNETIVMQEFKNLHQVFEKMQAEDDAIQILSMGMSGDYPTAIQQGSNMVRIGSLLFGERNKQ